MIRGGAWVAANIYPTVSFILAAFVLIVIPISLVLAIFKKTRGFGATGLLISSYALGLNLWLSSLIMAYVFAGTFWMIVGLLFGGIGVVPIAFIATLLSSEWLIAGQIFSMAVIVYGVRALSFYLSERADNKNEIVDEEFEKEFNAFWEEHQRINEIVEGFGIFLEKEKLPELEKGINALGACRVFLQSYTEIAPEDKDDVEYFNTYRTLDEVPKEEKTECTMLMGKYMTAFLKRA